MKLAVISMIRNETDIVGSFLQHLDALFDYAILMDHHSIDGTETALADGCARRPGWVLWHLEPIGYHQAKFCALALSYAMQQTDADFVFFMDADEFVNVPDRASLEAGLAGVTDPDRVGHLGWCNLLPDRLDARVFRLGETVWRPAIGSPLGKAVMSRSFYQRHSHEVYLMSGNHRFYYPPATAVPFDSVGEMLHLPVRSHIQMKSKLVAGVFSVMAQAGRQEGQSQHWFTILDRLADGTLRDDDLFGIVAQYGIGEGASEPIARDELAGRGYVRCQMSVATGRALVPIGEPNWIDPVRLVASILRNFRVEDANNAELVLDGDHVRLVVPN